MSKTKKSKTFIKIIYFDEGQQPTCFISLVAERSIDKEKK